MRSDKVSFGYMVDIVFDNIFPCNGFRKCMYTRKFRGDVIIGVVVWLQFPGYWIFAITIWWCLVNIGFGLLSHISNSCGKSEKSTFFGSSTIFNRKLKILRRWTSPFFLPKDSKYQKVKISSLEVNFLIFPNLIFFISTKALTRVWALV